MQPDDKLREWALDPRAYCRDLLKVQSVEGGLVPLKLNEVQELFFSIIEDIKRNGRLVRVVVLKARRQGLSTATAGRFFHGVVTRPNKYGAIICHEPDSAEFVFNMYRRMYQNLPDVMKPATKYNSIRRLEFNRPDGKGLDSAIRVAAAGREDIGSGMMINRFHGSEVAKWPAHTAEQIMTSVMQAVPQEPDTEVILESTAKGIGGLFYTRFMDARYVYTAYIDSDGVAKFKMDINEDTSESNMWASVFFPWFCFKRYSMKCPAGFVMTEQEKELKATYSLSTQQLAWRRWAIENNCGGSEQVFMQEYPACVDGSALVGTSLGIVPLSSVAIGSNVEGNIVSDFFPKGERRVWEIETSMGYQLKLTPDHLVKSNGLWVPVSSIAVGDKIALAPPTFSTKQCVVSYAEFPSIVSSVEITKDMARFLGYFMGDGSFYEDTVSIACDKSDQDVVSDIVGLCARLFNVVPSTRTVGNKGGGTEVRFGNKRLGFAFKQMGLLKKRHPGGWKRNVHVPPCILNSPSDIVREFLSALFEADGFNGYGSPRVVLFSKGKKFLLDVQLLLLGFGITSKARSAIKINGNGRAYTGNEIALRKEEAIAFNERIGFISNRKRSRVDTWRTTTKSGRNAIPLAMVDVISRIDDSGESCPVFDIQVENTHCFSANGIMVHNCSREAFLSTGSPVFDLPKLMAIAKDLKPPVSRYGWQQGTANFIADQGGNLMVWREPIPGRSYVISADVAEGIEVSSDTDEKSKYDFSCADVIDQLSGEQVAHWHGKIAPDLFAQLLFHLGKRYNTAWMIPERNGHGMGVVTSLFTMRYPRLWVEKVPDPPGKPRKRYGWLTSTSTKPMIIDNLVAAVRDGTHGINNKDTINEMLSYKRNPDGTMEAEKNQHDDRLMSYAIGQYVRTRLPLPSGVQRRPEDAWTMPAETSPVPSSRGWL